MAITITHNVTRLETWEGTPPGTFGTIGGGPGAAAEAGLHYEGAQCAARRIGGTGAERGFTYIDTATTSLLGAGNTIVLCKVMTALSAVITSGGTQVGYGDTVSDYYNYQVGDDGTMGDNGEFALPPKGGYVILPIEVRKSAWHNLTRTGSPDITVVDMYRMSHTVSATTGAGTSQALDSVDVTDDGLFLVGNTPDGVFQDFVDADEGEGVTGTERAGIWTSLGSTIFAYLTNVVGRNDAGTTSATTFTDEFFNVVFPGGFVGPGVNGLEFDLTNASTVVTLSNGTIAGEGRADKKVYFDTELDVTGGATDTINIPAHGLNTGDQVAYSAEGGTEDIGPDASTGEADDATASGVATTGDNWYVIRSDADTIQLAATAALALAASPTATSLTASTAGNGELHSLRRQPDTRPDIIVTSTVGSLAFTSVTLFRCGTITLTSAATLTTCSVVASQKLVLGDATLASCILNSPTTPIGEAFLEAAHAQDLDLIDNCSFISGGEGHAIEVTTNGTTAQNTADLSNVSFSGYFTGDEDGTGGWSFNANTDVDPTPDDIQITGHGFSTGDPVYYSDEGGTAIGGLTDQTLYYLRADDANNVGVFLTREAAETNTNRIALTAGSSETHKFYSANAAFFNNTGGAVTVNVLNGGVAPTVRNSAGSTTTVVNAVTIEITGVTEGAQCSIFAAAGGPETEGTSLMNQAANASGVASTSYDFSTDQPVTLSARSSGIIAAAIADDGGALTDETTVARDRSTTNDVTLFPTTPVVNVDQYYFGGLTQFDKLTVRVGTAGVGTYALTWEYWNGAWVTLTTTTADDFKATSANVITFSKPGDWATTTVNSQGPYYYVRARWTSGTMTTSPIGNNASMTVTKYVPFSQSDTITNAGLSVKAVWVEDTTA